MTLLEECINVLEGCKLLTSEKSESVTHDFENTFPFTQYGRIAWDDLSIKRVVSNVQSILLDEVIHPNDEVYIIWDELSLPIVATNIYTIIKYIDDVTAVSFDTWIYCQSKKYVIEFYHEGNVTIGQIKNSII